MLKIISIIVSLLAAPDGPAEADIVSDDHAYANQTPYGDPASTSIKAPPPGYQLVFLENVGRHGSRSQTSTDGEQRAYAVWKSASGKGQLTTAGKQFDDDLKTFQKAESAIGYGKLSALGKAQWAGIGRRTAANYHDFLTKAATTGDDIAFRTTSVTRTKQSAASLLTALDSRGPRARPQGGHGRRPDAHHRRLDQRGPGRDRQRAAPVRRTHGRAARAAPALHRRSIVDSLSDPVGKALDIYGLYAIAPGMQDRDPGDVQPLRPGRRRTPAGLRQGRAELLPLRSRRQGRDQLLPAGAAGARRLLLPARQAHSTGGHTAAVFRLAHGETTMPFAALSKMPGSTKQATTGTPYSYGNNPWRGYVAGRMAGNIEWAAYRNSTGAVLVTIRYNEQPVKLHSSCAQSTVDPYFYRVSALKKLPALSP